MKRFFSFLTIALLAVVLWVCSSGETEVALTASVETLQFAANGGSQKVTLTAGDDLEVTSSQPKWCTATFDAQKVLTVTTKKNLSAKKRSAEILLTAGSQSKTIAVSQKAGSGKIDAFTLSSLTFPDLYPTGRGEVNVNSSEGSYNIMITMTDPAYPWRIEVTEGDFVSTKYGENQKGSGYFSFEVEANNTVDVRQALLTIISEYEGAKCTYALTIIQDATHRIQDPIEAPKIEW